MSITTPNIILTPAESEIYSLIERKLNVLNTDFNIGVVQVPLHETLLRFTKNDKHKTCGQYTDIVLIGNKETAGKFAKCLHDLAISINPIFNLHIYVSESIEDNYGLYMVNVSCGEDSFKRHPFVIEYSIPYFKRNKQYI